MRISLVMGFLLLAQVSLADVCATDQLKPLLGDFQGIAAIVTAENEEFELRSPKPLAPTTVLNRSYFKFDEANPCTSFVVQIDYLNPEIVGLLTGNSVAREVKFFGVAQDETSFSLFVDGTKKGSLRRLDDSTFMAVFEAPNPLKPSQATICKEFISLSKMDSEIVRTLQCFNKVSDELVQYRLVKEKRVQN